MSTRMAIRVAPDTSVISPANVADRSACSTEVTHCASVAEAGALERARCTCGPAAAPRAGPARSSARHQAAVRSVQARARRRATRGEVDVAMTTPITRALSACFAPSRAPACAPRRAVKQRQALSSQDLVKRAAAALRRRKAPALGGDRPALDAVCVVDDHIHLAVLRRVLGNLINAGRTHPAPGFGDLTWNAILHADVVGRVVAGGVAADEHRGELVEGVRAVGFDVGVLRVPHEHRRLVVAVPVRASWQLALADLLQAAQQAAEEQALLQRISKGKLPRSEEHTSELQSR